MIYRPMLDDFELELMDSADIGFEKSIAEYEVPFANGALLDDMGVKARKFTIKTMWRRDNYERYGDFLEHAGKDILNTLIDPGLGIIHGRIRSVSVRRDERRCAELDIEFIEDANPDAVPAYAPPIVVLMEEGFGASAASLIEGMAAECKAAGADADLELEPDAPMVSASGGRFTALRFLASLDAASKTLNGGFNAALNPAESAVGMFNYGASAPGRIIGDIARAMERAAAVTGSAGQSPLAAIASLRGGIERMGAAASNLKHQIMATGAAIGAIVTGKAFDADEKQKAVVRRLEDTPVWRPDGTLSPMPPAQPVLTADELDAALAACRALLRDGVTAARETGAIAAADALAEQAEQLKRYVDIIKKERDRIVEVDAETVLPLHLLCLRHGVPYSYADRIATINNFWNPTFCSGKVRMYERR